MKKAIIAILIMASACAPDLQVKQDRIKNKAINKKERPTNNYLPLLGLLCLSVWMVDMIDHSN